MVAPERAGYGPPPSARRLPSAADRTRIAPHTRPTSPPYLAERGLGGSLSQRPRHLAKRRLGGVALASTGPTLSPPHLAKGELGGLAGRHRAPLLRRDLLHRSATPPTTPATSPAPAGPPHHRHRARTHNHRWPAPAPRCGPRRSHRPRRNQTPVPRITRRSSEGVFQPRVNRHDLIEQTGHGG